MAWRIAPGLMHEVEKKMAIAKSITDSVLEEARREYEVAHEHLFACLLVARPVTGLNGVHGFEVRFLPDRDAADATGPWVTIMEDDVTVDAFDDLDVDRLPEGFIDRVSGMDPVSVIRNI